MKVLAAVVVTLMWVQALMSLTFMSESFCVMLHREADFVTSS